MPLLSFVIPSYNEADSLPLLLKELGLVATEMHLTDHDLSFETLIIDDGSTDNTLDLLNTFRASRPDLSILNIGFISFSRNFGKEAALYAGLQNAKGDYVVTMDADMQDPPCLIPEMYSAVVDEGYDDAATFRTTRKGESTIRSALSNLFYKMINAMSDMKLKSGARDFRLMDRKMMDAILEVSERNRFSKGIFNWVGFKTKWIPYENVTRNNGETKWSLSSLFKYAIEGMVSFSIKPLAITSISGIILFAVAIIMALVIVLKTLIWGDPVAGWPSLACIVLFVSGLQLLCLGIMSQYLARAYIETKGRPIYLEQCRRLPDNESTRISFEKDS